MNGWVASVSGASPLTVALAVLVALVGALLIHNFGRRPAPPQRAPARRDPAASAAPRPDASLADIRSRMLAAAKRMDLSEALLPRLCVPDGRDGDFLFRDKFDVVYCSYERGTALFEHSSVAADDLLYRVFRDRAWTKAYVGLIGQDLPPEEHARQLAETQAALLERGDPRWAERLRSEQG